MTDPGSPPLFDDGKDPEALRTIGEVARALGIRQHVLRYWEEQFPMLKPVKRSGGRRYYRPEDVLLIEKIHRLVHGQGYTLRGARQAIRAGQVPENAGPGAGPEQPTGDILADLVEIRRRLAAALDAA